VSVIDDIIGQVERGEPVDWNKAMLLQALHVAKAGEEFVESCLKLHGDEDERIG